MSDENNEADAESDKKLIESFQQFVLNSGVIECLIRCFANPNYANSLKEDSATFFAKKIEEFLRHYPKLQPYGVKAIIHTLQQLRNKPYLELKEIYNSPNRKQNINIFPINDDEEMNLISNPPKPINDNKSIYPLFPSNDKIKEKMINKTEPCFTGNEESFWQCVTNIGKFLETSLKKLTSWNFVQEGGMKSLVHISHDPIMHYISTIYRFQRIGEI